MQSKSVTPPHLFLAYGGVGAPDQMDEECRRLAETTAGSRLPRKLADSRASAKNRADAYKCLPGIYRANVFAKYAPAHEMSARIRRGLCYPVKAQFLTQLRICLHEVRSSLGGGATQHSAAWRTVADSRGDRGGSNAKPGGKFLAWLKE